MMTVRELRPGQVAQVTALAGENEARRMKLIGLGISPGCLVRLQQRRPAYVVRFGETLLSLDEDVAAMIQVRLVAE